jgi:Zn-dependent protease
MFSSLDAQNIIVVLVAILISMAFHEAMHAFTAHALGDTTAKEAGRLTLNPFKHIDIMTTVLLPLVLILLGQAPIFVARPVPFDPRQVKYEEYGAALVGIAGPFTNLVLAILASFLLRFGIGTGALVTDIQIFMVINLSLFVFNMIPLPPLDGSRLLYAFAPEPLQEAMLRLEAAGFGVTLLILLLLLPVIGPFVGNIVNDLSSFLLR